MSGNIIILPRVPASLKKSVKKDNSTHVACLSREAVAMPTRRTLGRRRGVRAKRGGAKLGYLEEDRRGRRVVDFL